jgi:hypothetical protein
MWRHNLDTIVGITAHIAEVTTALAAAWWFFFTASFRKRIEFDVQCSVFSDPQSMEEKLTQLTFSLENRGQVESRCYTLAYEVQSVDAATKHHAPVFLKNSGNIVPPPAEYYYVRAGVTLRISARLWVPSNVSILRVRAFILYDGQRHEVRESSDLFEQMYQFDDWTALDRVFMVSGAEGDRRDIS